MRQCRNIGAALLLAAGVFVWGSDPNLADAGHPWPFPENPLIAIPGGAFVFGADDGEENEKPRQTIEIPGFTVNRTEITNAEYRRFVVEGQGRASNFDRHPELGKDDRPVVGVSWDDADAFCRFYGLKLPTEQQFERAARGATGRKYAWGDAPATPDRVSRGSETCCGPDAADGFPATAPVGSFPKGNTPEGVADLTGNVWEWMDGWYNPYGTPPAAEDKTYRVLRGGAWNSDDWKLRTTYRLAYRGDFRYAANGGFRCVGP